MIKKLLLSILGMAVIGTVAYVAAFAISDSYDVSLGQHRFRIPKEYSQQGVIPKWLSATPGLDDGSRSYTLVFSAEEIATRVPGYKPMDGRFKEDIRAILAVLTRADIKSYRDADRHRDLWHARNFYHQPTIEPYENRPWFRVYGKYEYPRMWSVIKKSLKRGDAFPQHVFDFWVADCVSGNSPITKSGKIVDCLTYVSYDDIAIDFYISEQNLDVVDDVRALLKSKVESWRVNDS